jgi:hypothetical protein
MRVRLISDSHFFSALFSPNEYENQMGDSSFRPLVRTEAPFDFNAYASLLVDSESPLGRSMATTPGATSERAAELFDRLLCISMKRRFHFTTILIILAIEN